MLETQQVFAQSIQEIRQQVATASLVGCGYIEQPAGVAVCSYRTPTGQIVQGPLGSPILPITTNFTQCGEQQYANSSNTASLRLCCVNGIIPNTSQSAGTCSAHVQRVESAATTLIVVESTDAPITQESNTRQETIQYQLCKQAGDKEVLCQACMDQSSTTPSIWTAIGCIDTSGEGIVGAIVRLALGISGGVVLFKILGASLKLTISKGEPKEVEEAREEITNAVIGLLFIVFSIVLLEFIGVSILQIPGF